MPAHEAIKAPLKLAPKEGLALLNGTQVSTALALIGLFAAEDVFAAAVAAGSLSVDAAAGSDTPFDSRIHALRGQAGQQLVARFYADLVADSEIRRSHLENDARVQDPYSLRCQPQVMGACLDQMRHAARIFEIEAAAVTDNPLVFPEKDEILSGGNFHAEPIALAADVLALAIAEVGALSERRIALLIDSTLSGLPPFLVEHGGVNSGFMVPQVTAAALASENKSLAHPASVDSLPTSANQEDHVAMATFAARRPFGHGVEQRGHRRDRAPLSRAGHRFPRPAEDVAEAAGDPLAHPLARRFLRPRPLLRARHHRDPGAHRVGRVPPLHARPRFLGVMELYKFRRGTAPLLVSMPHTGTHVPEWLAPRLTRAAKGLPDTDWHLEQLYNFVDDLGASVIVATHSRYVVDLNRPPDNANLYPGQDTTGVVPATRSTRRRSTCVASSPRMRKSARGSSSTGSRITPSSRRS